MTAAALLLTGLLSCCTPADHSAAPEKPGREPRPATILSRVTAKRKLTSFAANPRREQVVAGTWSGLWAVDPATAATREVLLKGLVMGTGFSPDGSVVYAAQPIARRLRAVDAETGQEKWSTGELPNVFSVSVTPDGRLLYLAQAPSPGALVVDTTTHEAHPLAASTARVWGWGAAFSPDGRRAFLSSFNDTQIFETATGMEIGHLGFGGGKLAVSPDGGVVYIGAGALTAVDVASGTAIWSTLGPSRLEEVTLTRDGRTAYLQTADPDGLVSVDTQTHAICELRTLPQPAKGIALGHDESRLYVRTVGDDILVVDARDLACR